MYVLPAFTSSITPKTPLAMYFNRKYFFFEQGLSITKPIRGRKLKHTAMKCTYNMKSNRAFRKKEDNNVRFFRKNIAE